MHFKYDEQPNGVRAGDDKVSSQKKAPQRLEVLLAAGQ
jgi:hypothetical protein